MGGCEWVGGWVVVGGWMNVSPSWNCGISLRPVLFHRASPWQVRAQAQFVVGALLHTIPRKAAQAALRSFLLSLQPGEPQVPPFLHNGFAMCASKVCAQLFLKKENQNFKKCIPNAVKIIGNLSNIFAMSRVDCAQGGHMWIVQTLYFDRRTRWILAYLCLCSFS